MSYGGASSGDNNYGLAEDVAVYSFDSLGDDHDLGGLLDDGMNDFNDETFGTSLGGQDDFSAFGGGIPSSASVGRDFDFAGNTARMLGQDKPLQQLDQSWISGAPSTTTSSSNNQNQSAVSQPPAAKNLDSAWNSLDADPLLSSYRPSPAAPRSYTSSNQYQRSNTAIPIPIPVTTGTTPAPANGAPRSNMRTLDEIEAEMRAQSQQQQQQYKPSAQPTIATKTPMTLEEIEAEMLRKARESQAQSRSTPQPSVQAQQTPIPIQQQASGFPPLGSQTPQQSSQQPFYGGVPPPPPPPFPTGPGGQARFPGPPPPLPLALGPNGIPLPPHLGGTQPSPMMMMHGGPNSAAMNTLFPPLPSQAGSVGGLAMVEQQLQFLTMNQHAQHPSLTSAQLQSLLQQAHQHQAAVASAGEGAKEGTAATAQEEGGGGDGAAEEEAKKKAAGEELIRTVEKRIMEHELMEQKRKRKAMKIASMAKHNNLMSNSDKDFITRIQVSQLVTDDPYADDFYFHIMAAIKMSRHQAALAAGAPIGSIPPPLIGSMGPPRMATPQQQGARNGPNNNNNNNNNRKPTRRENAMNRMAQNVQRLVDSAKQRNKAGQLSLDGALGKIALRTRSAPRQLLQVKPDAAANTSDKSNKNGNSTTAGPSTGSHLLEGLVTSVDHSKKAQDSDGKPLSHRAILSILEKIYDAVLDLEQMRRTQPQLLGAAAAAKEHLTAVSASESTGGGAPSEEIKANLEKQVQHTQQAVEEWDAKYAHLTETLWTELRVMEPLDRCSPHPFIGLISVLKGKKILPRALRHLSAEQTLTLLTLIVATFDTLDVVQDAPLLDSIDDGASSNKASSNLVENKQKRAIVETKTEVFLNAILAPVMSVIGQAPLRMVTGMLGLMMQRNDLTKVIQSKAGIAFLTIFLSRAESLKQATPAPDPNDLQGWQQTFDHLFDSLIQQLPRLFPSTRAIAILPFGAAAYLSNHQSIASNLNNGGGQLNAIRPDIDRDDEPVWRFLAAVAVCAEPNEQEQLVTSVRDKVLENVTSAKKARVAPEVAALKIRNVNLLLHSLGLDASQLTVED